MNGGLAMGSGNYPTDMPEAAVFNIVIRRLLFMDIYLFFRKYVKYRKKNGTKKMEYKSLVHRVATYFIFLIIPILSHGLNWFHYIDDSVIFFIDYVTVFSVFCLERCEFIQRKIFKHSRDYYRAFNNFQRQVMIKKICREEGIDFKRKEKIDLLINEVENIHPGDFDETKKAIALCSAIFIFFCQDEIKTIFSVNSIEGIFIVGEISVIVAIIYYFVRKTFPLLIKCIIYRDYSKYDELIYDLRQLRLMCDK